MEFLAQNGSLGNCPQNGRLNAEEWHFRLIVRIHVDVPSSICLINNEQSSHSSPIASPLSHNHAFECNSRNPLMMFWGGFASNPCNNGLSTRPKTMRPNPHYSAPKGYQCCVEELNPRFSFITISMSYFYLANRCCYTVWQ